MTPRVFVEIDSAMRGRIEALIERLIDLCDQLDAFCEGEAEDAEHEAEGEQ